MDGSATYYVHWDDTYLYLGWSGGSTNYSSDMFYAAIDTDPGAGTGSSNAIEGVDFDVTEMDYYVVYENNSSFYGVPTSNGYGFNGNGVGALTTMLQSCSPGLTVVNIDNGFGAGASAALIAKNSCKK